jgi:hypothetical protein
MCEKTERSCDDVDATLVISEEENVVGRKEGGVNDERVRA